MFTTKVKDKDLVAFRLWSRPNALDSFRTHGPSLATSLDPHRCFEHRCLSHHNLRHPVQPDAQLL